jgi:hypothetical protein
MALICQISGKQKLIKSHQIFTKGSKQSSQNIKGFLKFSTLIVGP